MWSMLHFELLADSTSFGKAGNDECIQTLFSYQLL